MYLSDGITQDVQARRQQACHDIKIALSGLLTSNIGMLLLFIPTPTKTAKRLKGTITLHYHCVTATYLCLDKSIRHGCCNLQQHHGQVLIGLFACCH